MNVLEVSIAMLIESTSILHLPRPEPTREVDKKEKEKKKDMDDGTAATTNN